MTGTRPLERMPDGNGRSEAALGLGCLPRTFHCCLVCRGNEVSLSAYRIVWVGRPDGSVVGYLFATPQFGDLMAGDWRTDKFTTLLLDYAGYAYKAAVSEPDGCQVASLCELSP